MYSSTMVTIVAEGFASGSIQEHRITDATNHQAVAIGRPGDSIPWCASASNKIQAYIGDNVTASESIPYLHSAIVARGGDTCSFGRPGNVKNSVAVSMIGIEAITICGIPHLHSCIETARGKVFAIGRPGDAKDVGGMAT